MDIKVHLSNLDHGQIADLIGNHKIVELISEIVRSKGNIVKKGELILDLIGGVQGIIENVKRRKIFLLTLSGKQRKDLRKLLDIRNIDTFNLTKKRKTILYSFFNEIEPNEVNNEINTYSVSLLKVKYGLFKHQSEILIKANKILSSDKPRVMLHMPTGSGKTRTAMHLIARYLNDVKEGIIVWLVSGIVLCDQAAKEFEKAWENLGDRPLTILKIWGGVHNIDKNSFTCKVDPSRQINKNTFEYTNWPSDLPDGVIIGSIDSIYELCQKWEPNERILRQENIKLIVFDEAHRSTAPTYIAAIELLSNDHTGLLGLSATPGKKLHGQYNIESESIVNLFSGNKVVLEIPGYKSPIDALIDQGYLAKLKKEKLEIINSDLTLNEIETIQKSLTESLELPEGLLNYFGYDATRNLQIIDRIEKLMLQEGCNRAIVFAPSKPASDLISNILNARGIQSTSITHETPSKKRESSFEMYNSTNLHNKHVLVNYGVLTAGFDAPCTSAVIIARPTNSIVLLSQMAGRALRGPNVGGNAESKLITVVDTKIPELVSTINQFHAFDEAWI
jgi:DNA repair protein RadD